MGLWVWKRNEAEGREANAKKCLIESHSGVLIIQGIFRQAEQKNTI